MPSSALHKHLIQKNNMHIVKGCLTGSATDVDMGTLKRTTAGNTYIRHVRREGTVFSTVWI